jgi:hypothetical protein
MAFDDDKIAAMNVNWEKALASMKSNTDLLMVPGKRAGSMVAAGNTTGLMKDNPKWLKDQTKARKMREKRMDDDSKEAASSAAKSRSISDFFSPKVPTSDSPSATSEAAVGDSLQEVTRSLFGTEDEGDSDVLLMDDDFELEAAVREALTGRESDGAAPAVVLSMRKRLQLMADNMQAKGNCRGYLTVNAFSKYEELLRAGNSHLQAGRLVATQFYVREREPRVNASKNEHNRKYWYRWRARHIICGYHYFAATGELLPETRGRSKGKSHIHDPAVQQMCRRVISSLGKTWSARTFRDRLPPSPGFQHHHTEHAPPFDTGRRRSPRH